MVGSLFMRTFVALVTLLSIGGLAYVFVAPPESTRVSRDGVPFFTPQVVNPETSEPVSVDVLIRHFKGG